jgi:curved DNA-binding protein CbpA
MSAPDFDPYAVLGVRPQATADEIKVAYRELVARYHPDRHQGNPLEDLAAAKLADINRAYEILSDPARRAAYDAGQPSWPRPVGSPFDNVSFAGRGRKRAPWLYLLGGLLLLPLLIRLGVFVVRMLIRLVRVGAEGFTAARGTPLLLITVVVVATAIILFFRRRRR